MVNTIENNDELMHFGIKGMKWGVRRFQNKDGTRTTLGKKRERENVGGNDDSQIKSGAFGSSKKSSIRDDEINDVIKTSMGEVDSYLAKKDYWMASNRLQGVMMFTYNKLINAGMDSNDASKRSDKAVMDAAQKIIDSGKKDKEIDTDSVISEVSANLDAGCYDNPSVLVVDKSSSKILSYESFGSAGRKGAEYNEDYTGYTIKSLDTAYGNKPGTVDYWVWGEKQSDEAKHSDLSHSGTKGMKWGIRRYQNKDGSLTPLGRKRYGTKTNFEKVQAVKRAGERQNSKATKNRAAANARTEAEIAKLKKKYGMEDKTETKTEKKEPTIDELREKAAYMKAKNDYDREMMTYNANHPPKVPAGEKFVKNILNDVVMPAAKNSGKQWLEKQIKDALKVDEKDATQQLKKEYDKLKAKKDLDDLKKSIADSKDTSYADRKKEYDRQKLEKDFEALNKDTSEYDALKKEYDTAKLRKDIDDLNNPKNDPTEYFKKANQSYAQYKQYEKNAKEWAERMKDNPAPDEADTAGKEYTYELMKRYGR